MFFKCYKTKSYLYDFFSFSTEVTDGLLLYVSRYSQVNDLLAIEIIETQIAFSFAVGTITMRVMVGTPGGVSDLKWHLVELVYRDKVLKGLFSSKRLIWSLLGQLAEAKLLRDLLFNGSE